MDPERHLEELQAKKAEIRRQREDLSLQEELLDSQIAVLARRVGGEPPRLPSRTSRIIGILRSTDEPMSPKEIADMLAVVEPDITPNVVRATLDYLKRRGAVERPGRGLWRPVADE